MSFPRYEKTKASGTDWLGQVPEHWKIVPLKHLAEFINGDAFKPAEWAESGIPIIRIQNLNGSEEFNYFDGEVEDRYLVHDGDLLFGWSGNRGTSFGPFLWRRKEVCALNQHIFRVIPYSMNKHELFWTLKAVTAHVEDQAHGIIGMVHVTKGDLGAINVPVPPLPEQLRIAAFLERETGKIDELVAEQRQLIEILKNKRQSLISHAVTKGLNPNAPMRSTGIEWLAGVPEHWEVERLKNLISKIEQGWSPQCDNEPAMDDEWGVLKVGCGNRDVFDPTEQKALPLEIAPLIEYEIRPGDILMSRGNTRDLVGMATLVKQVRSKLLLCDLLYRFHAKSDRIDPEFLVFSLRSANVRFQIEREATGTSASMKKIGQGTIQEFVICCPPLAEQKKIVTQIQTETAKLDTLTAEALRAIDLLQERRVALISAAVTGKIDVRGLVEAEAA